MLLTRARTRASAGVCRVLAGCQTGSLLHSAQDAKCYTITAPRPGSFRFMTAQPQLWATASPCLPSRASSGRPDPLPRSNHTGLS